MKLRGILLSALLLLITLAISVWWFRTMERKPEWQWRPASAEMREQPLLLAARFLEKNGLKVRQIPDLSTHQQELPQAGVIVLPWRNSSLARSDHDALMRWVNAGGVLFTSTGGRDYDDDDKLIDPRESDQLLRELDLQHAEYDPTHEDDEHDSEDDASTLAQLSLPGVDHALQIDTDMLAALQPGKVSPAWSDETGPYLLAYRHGRGWIVLTSGIQHLLANGSLQQRDHAELLWHVSRLAGPSANVWLVSGQSNLPWYTLLWMKLPWPLLGLALLLPLALWRASCRFGPLLPNEASPRRAILEHIDGSARWLWQREAGRHHLLSAARQALRQRIANRLPELSRLPDHELIRVLSLRYEVPATALEQALTGRCPSHPAQFTARIALLQSLRNRL
ncbi:DUF4350 domain-containing protein [Chitinilyticum aquatile]|uniref:DUF4350 domain-containing protein n=1 Tax=Chitinilyticum aquatile TaxID=362520 RepID=UPI0003FB2F47|nr:DUF4350 domain-containing protein [Chitinilyticum aquatile]